MDYVYFLLSKIIWSIIQPSTWILIFLSIGLIAQWRGANKTSLTMLSMCIIFFLIVAIFPIGSLLLYPLEKRFNNTPLLSNVNGIIILGGFEDEQLSRFWNQPQLNGSAERVLAGVLLSKKFPKATLLYTGGSGQILNQSDKNSFVANQIFTNLGVDPNQIEHESRSRNTAESARNSFNTINPKPSDKWVLVTSAAHMSRSIGVFCHDNWSVIPYPVDYRSGVFWDKLGWRYTQNLEDLAIGIKEWVGLVVYRLTGKTNAFLPNTC